MNIRLHPNSRRIALGCLLASLPVAAAPADISAPPPRRMPRLAPDYTDIVLPPNIAPMNFIIEEDGARFRTRLSGPAGSPIELAERSPRVAIPIRPWNALLRANVGSHILIEIAVLSREGQWLAFQAVTNRVAPDELDGHLVYRRLLPLYNIYRTMGIYQRDLETFKETPVLENTRFGRGCLNCHTFLQHSPDRMALHIRSQDSGNPMLLIASNQVATVAKTSGYMSWHPSGRLLAASANKLSLFFHTKGETRDVFDADSDLEIYRVDSNTAVSPHAIARPDRLETWPCWAPDGRALYFSSAPKLGNMDRRRFRQVRYDLIRVPYDLELDRWGEPETIVSAEATGRSAVQPRVSPDGRFLVYGLCAYGHFPIYQPSSDLHLLDLTTREHRRLDINSSAADTWHCWSSNSRWLVFSSKRLDGLFARPFFSHVDPAGRFSKPFLLPQRDPAYFDSCLETFNVPELIQSPITVAPADLARAATRPNRLLKPAVQPPAQGDAPAPVREYEDAHTEQGEPPASGTTD